MDTALTSTRTAYDQAKQSFTGSRLTDARFDKGWNFVAMLHRDLHHTGSFIEKLTDYARTFAGRETVDASREEMILRDLYKERYGQTLNETREALIANEAKLREAGDETALTYARDTLDLIRAGETMPHYLAADQTANIMARQTGISEAGAKKMMSEAFERAEGKPFYETCKTLETEHHLPVREAQREARKAERQALTRTGPDR